MVASAGQFDRQYGRACRQDRRPACINNDESSWVEFTDGERSYFCDLRSNLVSLRRPAQGVYDSRRPGDGEEVAGGGALSPREQGGGVGISYAVADFYTRAQRTARGGAGWCRRGAQACLRLGGRRGIVTMDPDSDNEVKLRWPDGATSGYIGVGRLAPRALVRCSVPNRAAQLPWWWFLGGHRFTC